MSIFKIFKKEAAVNQFNKRIMDGALYQLMLRYFDVEYGFGGNIDWKISRYKSCEYLKVATCGNRVAIKFDYAKFPKESMCLAQFCEIMRDLTEYVIDFVMTDDFIDPFETIVPDDTREAYISNKVNEICANVYKMVRTYPNIVITSNLRQNWQVHNILMDGYKSGLDLHSSVIFHENELYMNESTYNVRDLSLNSAFALIEIESVLLVYSGTIFNPRERTAPLFPMMDYIIVRSYYGRYKIGESVGFEEDCKLYLSRAKHSNSAHEYCVNFLEEYHNDRNMKMRDLDIPQDDEAFIDEREEQEDE